jgi:hypothetical protein
LIWHPPRLSDEYKWEILRSLALIETGVVTLSKLLQMLRPSADRKSSLILITPSISGRWLPSLLALRRLGVVPTVFLFDTQTFGGPGSPESLAGELVAQGITVQILPRELLERDESQAVLSQDWGWREGPSGRLVPASGRDEFSWRGL